MSARRKPRSGGNENINQQTPAQLSEEEILTQAGVEQDDEGNLVADEEKIKELGAIDTESVIENRRAADVVGKRRANGKKIPFNTSNPIDAYDVMIQTWPPNTLDITFTRLSGGNPITGRITNRPKSGSELLKTLEQYHGKNEEAEYSVVCKDATQKCYRGTFRVFLPDTRQLEQPMGHYPPPGYPPGYYPPGYPPVAYGPPGQPQPPAPQHMPPPPPPPPPPPVLVQQDMPGTLDALRQLLEITQTMRPPQAPAPAPVSFPPAPPPGADIAAQMQYLKEALAIVQQMTPQQIPPQTVVAMPPQPPPPPPQPQQNGMESMMAAMGMMREMFSLFQQMQPPPPPPPPQYREPRPPPPFMRDQGIGGPRYPQQQHQQPQDPLRDMLSNVRNARRTVEELGQFFSEGQRNEDSAPAPVAEEDSPVQIIEAGGNKLVVNKSDGKLRAIDTGFANLQTVLKFVSEEAEKFRQTRQPQKAVQQLPAGYVEVTEGYQPPAGYVAVPVDPRQIAAAPSQEERLPPPPQTVPPPVGETPRASWGMPVISGERN